MALQMMILYMIGGVSIAVFAIVWALSSRQFQEQERARFLPFRDLDGAELEHRPSLRITPSVALVFVILVAGLGAVVHLLVRVFVFN
jgi:nitrogen fixation-related uncharacterized protein